jgi:outer membrane protein insertion porin family
MSPSTPAASQIQSYEILGISVEGDVSDETRQFVKNTSGLTVGQQVRMPGSEAFSDAVRQLYRVGAFSDVSISIDRQVSDGLYLTISVAQELPLADYRFVGIKNKHAENIRERAPLVVGRALRPSDVERTGHIIKQYFKEEGYRQATVTVDRTVTENDRVELTFDIDRGPKVEVSEIRIEGNEVFSDWSLRRTMDTKVNRWWRIWKGETFQEDEFRSDLQSIIDKYNQDGYIDARIVSDTTYLAPPKTGEAVSDRLIVAIEIEEGPQYRVRDIEWEGNTVFNDAQLTQALGFQTGDIFDRQKLRANLSGNRQSSDVSSLYMDRGYMYFNAEPLIMEAPGDSLDIHFEVVEGDVFEFGEINIVGNTKTKSHVIRRELYTVPGRTFSRSAIQRSIRQLEQLEYFSSQSLQGGPEMNPDPESQKVDLTYRLEETGSDQLELSGGWGGGAIGLMLQARLTFNNFSAGGLLDSDAWRPLPAGDGQTLSLSVQMGGRTYQNYSLSFQEPWFRGKPNPFGFSVSHYRADYGRYRGYYDRQFGGAGSSRAVGSRFAVTSGNISYGHRLNWPDDFFQTSTELGYHLYNIGTGTSLFGLPPGRSQQVSVKQTLKRNSVDNPMFPTSGSQFSLSLEVAPPFKEFIQYHKTELSTAWHTPLIGDLTFSVEADYGMLGTLSGDRVDFERYLVGGTPLQARGFTFGKDLRYMRGYPLQAISPRRDGEAVGGTILNKYTAEVRVLGIDSPQLRLAPYVFFDAANTWNSLATYNPAQLYRSAGIGAKVFLPILGMVEVSYGYNFDRFQASGDNGAPQWRFQFSLGQGF